MHRAPVNKLIPFSAVDGPGNRTAIFTQGCNFNCLYCHNPETINLCTGCGKCISVCPAEALLLKSEDVVWTQSLCLNCDECIKTCIYDSSPRTRLMTAEEVLTQTPLPFITGITVSGGECTLWPGFLTELFEGAKKLNKTAFADTNGFSDFRAMPELVEAMDMAMVDFKAGNPNEHNMLTGRDNSSVIENISYLTDINKLYEVRTVVIDGLIDNMRTVELAAGLIGDKARYKLIRFRPLGVRGNLQGVPSDDLMLSLAAVAENRGVKDIIIV